MSGCDDSIELKAFCANDCVATNRYVCHRPFKQQKIMYTDIQSKLIKAHIALGDTVISCSIFLNADDLVAASSWQSLGVSNHG
jgi:hypothetical protein